jgi:hypothetical protein
MPDLTDAVEAAAQAVWEAKRSHDRLHHTGDAPPWEEIPPFAQYGVRQAVLPAVNAVIATLEPDMPQVTFQWALRVKGGPMDGEIHVTYRNRAEAERALANPPLWWDDVDRNRAYTIVRRKVTEWEPAPPATPPAPQQSS